MWRGCVSGVGMLPSPKVQRAVISATNLHLNFWTFSRPFGAIIDPLNLGRFGRPVAATKAIEGQLT